MATEPEILFERLGTLGLITLNRPQALNALNRGMCLAMHEQMRIWRGDPAVKVVAVRGAGGRAFCAGGDIRSLYEEGRKGTSVPRTSMPTSTGSTLLSTTLRSPTSRSWTASPWAAVSVSPSTDGIGS